MSEDGEWLCRDCLIRQFARQTWKMRTWVGKMDKSDPIYIEAENFWRLLNDAMIAFSISKIRCEEKDIGKCRERDPEALVKKGEFLKDLFEALQGYEAHPRDARLLDYEALSALAQSAEGQEIAIRYHRFKTRKFTEDFVGNGE